MGKLSTHVLDVSSGCPAAGMKISLWTLEGERKLLKEAVSNADGRPDAPLLAGEEMRAGKYELVFSVGAYFRAKGEKAAEPAFLDEVPVRFGIGDAGGSYHVPLLCTPWSYSTYKGS